LKKEDLQCITWPLQIVEAKTMEENRTKNWFGPQYRMHLTNSNTSQVCIGQEYLICSLATVTTNHVGNGEIQEHSTKHALEIACLVEARIVNLINKGIIPDWII